MECFLEQGVKKVMALQAPAVSPAGAVVGLGFFNVPVSAPG